MADLLTPRTLHRDTTPAEGDLTRLVAVTHGLAIEVVASLGPTTSVTSSSISSARTPRPTPIDRVRRPLWATPHQLPQHLLNLRGQRVLHLCDGLVGRYIFLHGGSSLDLGRSLQTRPAAPVSFPPQHGHTSRYGGGAQENLASPDQGFILLTSSPADRNAMQASWSRFRPARDLLQSVKFLPLRRSATDGHQLFRRTLRSGASGRKK
jgi:hypothetical protein